LLGKALMVQGTASDSGKSTIVMALCRIFTNMGYKVAPFKSQNMSLNSFVSEDGLEIARSQVVQAMAAKIKPQAIHNPVLLKPKGNNESQIVLLGKPYVDYQVLEYYSKYIPKLIPHIKSSLDTLLTENDLVIIEGAGSPAEINLMEHEIANMYIAKLINAPVILVGDIDKGGVFASIYGTIELVLPEEKKLIKAYLINKFRGEEKFLYNGIDQLSEKVGKPCLGIVPYLENLNIPAEDSLNMKESSNNSQNNDQNTIIVKVIRLPKISNFTDYDALISEPYINLKYCIHPKELENADIIIIPGTKNTVSDLLWMQSQGLDKKIIECNQKGAIIVGICGGFQMLCAEIKDDGIEGDGIRDYPGLSLLPSTTKFKAYEKKTEQVEAKIVNIPNLNGLIVSGYEIHMGMIENIDDKEKALPFLEYNISDTTLENSQKKKSKYALGLKNKKDSVFGTFLHGIWDNDDFRVRFLEFVASHRNKQFNSQSSINYWNLVEQSIEKVANTVKEHLDMALIKKIIGFTSE
jgi:adenosylcobyric acid synthase